MNFLGEMRFVTFLFLTFYVNHGHSVGENQKTSGKPYVSLRRKFAGNAFLFLSLSHSLLFSSSCGVTWREKDRKSRLFQSKIKTIL